MTRYGNHTAALLTIGGAFFVEFLDFFAAATGIVISVWEICTGWDASDPDCRELFTGISINDVFVCSEGFFAMLPFLYRLFQP